MTMIRIRKSCSKSLKKCWGENVRIILTLIFLLLTTNCLKAAFPKSEVAKVKKELLAKLKIPLKGDAVGKTKTLILSHGGKSVEALVEVMKNGKYPELNRWIATFMLGRIMGKKASPFLAKFLKHPHWPMRVAALKTLLALKDDRFASAYAHALSDKSMLVRKQALENVRRLGLKQTAPTVWAMLYDKKNYHFNKSGKKGTHFVKDIVRTIGEFKFQKARKPLLGMIQKDHYKNIFSEMEHALQKITGKKIPKGGIEARRRYWKKVAISDARF